MGRPLKFKTPAELQKRVDEYFAHCKKTKDPLTITDLALFLGVTTETLAEYEGRVAGRKKGKDESVHELFAWIIKEAKEKCLASLQRNALKNNHNATVSIFLMKANHGLRDGNNEVVVIKNDIKLDDDTIEKIKGVVKKNKY